MKTYRHREGKKCSRGGCKRKVHAHVEKEPYCSTHYRLAKIESNKEKSERTLRSQSNLIRLMEKALRKGGKRDIRLALAIVTYLPPYPGDQDKLINIKRGLWFAVLKKDTAFLEDMFYAVK